MPRLRGRIAGKDVPSRQLILFCAVEVFEYEGHIAPKSTYFGEVCDVIQPAQPWPHFIEVYPQPVLQHDILGVTADHVWSELLKGVADEGARAEVLARCQH